jgi:hypothetical protein
VSGNAGTLGEIACRQLAEVSLGFVRVIVRRILDHLARRDACAIANAGDHCAMTWSPSLTVTSTIARRRVESRKIQATRRYDRSSTGDLGSYCFGAAGCAGVGVAGVVAGAGALDCVVVVAGPVVPTLPLLKNPR